MIDASPSVPPVVMVENEMTHEETFFFAFMAVGGEQAAQTLEKTAADGNIDMDKEATVESPSTIMVSDW